MAASKESPTAVPKEYSKVDQKECLSVDLKVLHSVASLEWTMVGLLEHQLVVQ